MTTSVAVVENGKVAFEPSEITYRTIFYYLDASMAKMLQPNNGSPSAPAKTDQPKTDQPKAANATSATENRMAALIQPRPSVDKLMVSAIQPPTGNSAASIVNTGQPLVSVDSEAPPAPRTILKPISGGVLNGQAVSLPSPIYPETALRVRAFGKVEVEVVVDENGRVISAQAVSGPNMLRDVSAQAARRARFSPTKLSGQPVKVVGKIFYNFVLP
jgi:TonB family protein